MLWAHGRGSGLEWAMGARVRSRGGGLAPVVMRRDNCGLDRNTGERTPGGEEMRWVQAYQAGREGMQAK